MDPKYIVRKETNLRIHETEFTDNYIDPFKLPTYEEQSLHESYTNSRQYDKTPNEPLESLLMTHVIRLDTVKQVQKRVRYTLWDAIADIGGFSDGLFALIGWIVRSVASALFYVDLFKKTH